MSEVMINQYYSEFPNFVLCDIQLVLQIKGYPNIFFPISQQDLKLCVLIISRMNKFEGYSDQTGTFRRHILVSSCSINTLIPLEIF